MPRDFAKSRSKLIYLSKLGGLVHAEVLIDHRVALGDRLDAAGEDDRPAGVIRRTSRAIGDLARRRVAEDRLALRSRARRDGVELAANGDRGARALRVDLRCVVGRRRDRRDDVALHESDRLRTGLSLGREDVLLGLGGAVQSDGESESARRDRAVRDEVEGRVDGLTRIDLLPRNADGRISLNSCLDAES